MNINEYIYIYIQTILLFDFPMIYYIDYNIKIKVDEYVKLKPPKMNINEYIYIYRQYFYLIFQ